MAAGRWLGSVLDRCLGARTKAYVIYFGSDAIVLAKEFAAELRSPILVTRSSDRYKSVMSVRVLLSIVPGPSYDPSARYDIDKMVEQDVQLRLMDMGIGVPPSDVPLDVEVTIPANEPTRVVEFLNNAPPLESCVPTRRKS